MLACKATYRYLSDQSKQKDKQKFYDRQYTHVLDRVINVKQALNIALDDNEVSRVVIGWMLGNVVEILAGEPKQERGDYSQSGYYHTNLHTSTRCY